MSYEFFFSIPVAIIIAADKGIDSVFRQQSFENGRPGVIRKNPFFSVLKAIYIAIVVEIWSENVHCFEL